MQQHHWSIYNSQQKVYSTGTRVKVQKMLVAARSQLTLTLLAPPVAVATLVPILLPTPALLVEVLVPTLVPVSLLRST